MNQDYIDDIEQSQAYDWYHIGVERPLVLDAGSVYVVNGVQHKSACGYLALHICLLMHYHAGKLSVSLMRRIASGEITPQWFKWAAQDYATDELITHVGFERIANQLGVTIVVREPAGKMFRWGVGEPTLTLYLEPGHYTIYLNNDRLMADRIVQMYPSYRLHVKTLVNVFDLIDIPDNTPSCEKAIIETIVAEATSVADGWMAEQYGNGLEPSSAEYKEKAVAAAIILCKDSMDFLREVCCKLETGM